ncbi:MAG TPA: bifunctional adenosylcobinamide kinase/adenosylcobinamide-phosphate guanylyltransferase [Candidatus Mailhella merdavium]|nr:bifunctional adenosylcobinamide kinase/adenosylcobinamide-phosphate guanylyltransferase [Candidatus Mailhella merdavium]
MTDTLLVVGGCRSGKSEAAMQWALRRPGPRAYIATARPPVRREMSGREATEWDDPEMQARIARHQAERGPDWLTLLACEDGRGPLCTAENALLQAAESCRAAVFDSVGMWIAGLMEKEDAFILGRVKSLARWLEQSPLPVALVSDEVGMGLVPETAVGRRFRDLQGEANQILARSCRNVMFCACGIPLMLKGRMD